MSAEPSKAVFLKFRTFTFASSLFTYVVNELATIPRHPIIIVHCMGTSVEIPENGKICPRLPTNMVPSGTKCEVTCDSGSPNLEYIKCEAEGWSSTDVQCSGSPAGLIVGLLVGGIIIVCIIAYVYARVKQKKKDKAQGVTHKNQPLSRAAQIEARNDLMVTGVVTDAAVKTGVVKPATRKPSRKLVTGDTEQIQYRHPSSSSQVSNPPSYHSYNANDERSRNGTPAKNNGRRSRNSNSEYPTSQRKPRQHHNEYVEEVDLGYHEGLPVAPPTDGQYQAMQDNAAMYPEYYGAQQGHQQRYGGVDQNYYRQESRAYPDQYLNGGQNNAAYAHGGGSYKKAYRVPI